MPITNEGRELALNGLIRYDATTNSFNGKRRIRVLDSSNNVLQTLDYESFIYNSQENYVQQGANPIEFTMTPGQNVAKVQIFSLPTSGSPVWEEVLPQVREFPNGGIYRVPTWIIKVP